MIFNIFFPDYAMNGQTRLAPMNGEGCSVPAVTCPDKEIGDRCILQRCFNCDNYVRHDDWMLTCKYNEPKQVKKEIVPEKPIKVIKPRKEPTGVFNVED
jgi:hypothetical protein